MVHILENNLVQCVQVSVGEQVPVATLGLSEFEQRINSLISQLGNPSAKSLNCPEPEPEASPTVKASGANAPSDMGMALIEMTEIAREVARTDQMIDQVKDGVPDCDEAKRWHDISLQALNYSRDLLTQRQQSCLAKLGSVEGPGAEPPEYMEEIQLPEPAPEAPTWMGWSEADVRACPEFKPKVNVATRAAQAKLEVTGGGSLRQDLEILRESHPERVIIVRRIKQLGFESPQVLKEHFLQYGGVSEVLVAHSHVKSSPQRPNSRVRPAALGFVVMDSEKSAECALEAGGEQAVGGTVIRLSPFTAFESPSTES